MKRLAIISHKGGAGKTTSAVMLAEDFARRGARVVLVDADRQRGAGLLLGIEDATGAVQQTRNPRLRYFCSSAMPLREIPERAEELAGLFDVAVIDTPSRDDPLAKAWIQLSTDVLFILPVEPLSIRTLESADTLLEGIRRLNPRIRNLGTLPTMFDAADTHQRSLLMEVVSVRPEGLMQTPVPMDNGLVHRAQQKEERRTEPSEETIRAYQAAGDVLAAALGLTEEPAPAPAAKRAEKPGREKVHREKPAPAAAYTKRQPPAAAAVPVAAAPQVSGRAPQVLQWATALILALALLIFSVGYLLRGAPAASTGAQPTPAKAKAGKPKPEAKKPAVTASVK